MNDCEKCRELISCLLDGELSDSERSFVRGHIADCPECSAVYEAFSAISGQMKLEEDIPDGLHEKIMSGIKAKPRKKTGGIVWIKYLSAAACLAIVIFAGAKSGVFGPATNGADSSNPYVTETLPILDGRFTGQSDEESGDKAAYTQEQGAKTSVTLAAEDFEKLIALIKPADGAEKYEPAGEADYAVGLDDGSDTGIVLIYIEGERVYADSGDGAFPASCTADEICKILDAWA